MLKNDCLEKLKDYKLEHQTWFNDIHVRLNKLLVEKKKVRFESLSNVASKWIVPADSMLKNLEGFTAIQKLILVEVQEYKKIIDLINIPLSTSFFESKIKAYQKRNEKIIFHADVLSKAYQDIIGSFNKLEQDLILKRITCKPSVIEHTTTKDSENTSSKKIKKEDTIKTEKLKKENLKKEKNEKVQHQKESTKKESATKELLIDSKNIKKKSIEKKPVKKEQIQNETFEKVATKEPSSKQEVNPLIAGNKELLNSLNINRTKTAPKEEQKTALAEEFKLEDEIKRIIG